MKLLTKELSKGKPKLSIFSSLHVVCNSQLFRSVYSLCDILDWMLSQLLNSSAGLFSRIYILFSGFFIKFIRFLVESLFTTDRFFMNLSICVFCCVVVVVVANPLTISFYTYDRRYEKFFRKSWTELRDRHESPLVFRFTFRFSTLVSFLFWVIYNVDIIFIFLYIICRTFVFSSK